MIQPGTNKREEYYVQANHYGPACVRVSEDTHGKGREELAALLAIEALQPYAQFS